VGADDFIHFYFFSIFTTICISTPFASSDHFQRYIY